MEEEKTRKERRKEARLAKKKERYSSWIQHRKSQKEKISKFKLRSLAIENPKEDKISILNGEMNLHELDNKPKKKFKQTLDPDCSENLMGKESQKKKIVQSKIDPTFIPNGDICLLGLNNKQKPDSMDAKDSMLKKKKGLKRSMTKTKFEEYVEMEMKRGGVVSVEEDLEMERKLAKKLKVKNGKLRGLDDGLNMLFGEVTSVFDSKEGDNEAADVKEGIIDESAQPQCSLSKKEKKKKRKKLNASLEKDEVEHDVEADEDMMEGLEEANGGAEVKVEKPSAESCKADKEEKYIAPHLRAHELSQSAEYAQIKRRVRGLLNRLSETNVESITGEVSSVIQSVTRREGCQIICDEVLASCSNGPRGNEQYAAVFAAFVAGISCLLGIDFSAKLLASVARSFEDEYSKEDSLSARNLTLLLSYLCIFGVCSSDLIFDFLSVLSKRLTELDVSTILTVLHCCGMKLRGDDPIAMKDFILQVQSRVNELKSLSGSEVDGKPKTNNKRMEFMLETICEIKNNRKRQKEDSIPHTRLKKWLQKLHIEDVLLRGLKWSLLLDPDKKGQWWLSGNTTSTSNNVAEVANTIDLEVLEAQKLLKLAASQRMNTDARRAIFCVIMSSEDYMDAFEKILRLDLPGKQDREVMRVLIECCLQEKVFNKYYSVLAAKLCGHGKNHKFTLQYCLWDHFKELDSMELSRSMNLARFVAEMLASFSLSLAVLKVVDFSDPGQLSPRRVIFFQMLFELIFEKPDTLVWNIITRIAGAPEYELLRNNLKLFIKKYVVDTNKSAAGKFKLVKKALNNLTGVLM